MKASKRSSYIYVYTHPVSVSCERSLIYLSCNNIDNYLYIYVVNIDNYLYIYVVNIDKYLYI